MHALISYLLKLSISLCIVWLFYQLVLRRLTFYNSNRWYLLFFTALSFCIPFINISGIVNNNSTGENGLIQFIPSVHSYTIALEEATQCPAPLWSTQFDKWDWMAFALMAGAGILFIRFIVRYISFLRIRNNAELISDEGIKIYQVDESIIPFSFGNAVFINCNQHSSEELEEIVRHEFVHVRQKHTIDIIWAELLCILNWYNPFVWMLKKSIRQNLEFIADNKVIENGINKKQYQYLLLKVIGNNQYSIATQFNFSSLKKRIAMMNKTKSAKRQVARFLFLVPVLAVILVSFRKSFSDPVKMRSGNGTQVFTDTVPEVKDANSKGYFIDIKDNKGNCVIVIKDKDKKEVKRLLLTEWNEKADYYENLYGEIPPPPPPAPAKAALPTNEQWIKAGNSNVKSVSVNNNLAMVTLKNGKTENYDLNNEAEKKSFESKYGKMPEPPLPPQPAKAGVAVPLPALPAKASAPGEPAQPPVPAGIEVPGQPAKAPKPPTPPSKVIGVKEKGTTKAEYFLKDDVITVNLKDGRKEVYDLKNDKEKKEFTEKYGEPVMAESITTVALNPVSKVNLQVVPVIATTVKSNVVVNNNLNAVTVTSSKIATDNVVNLKLATIVSSPAVVNLNSNITTTVEPAIVTNIDVDIIITISKTTSEDELEKMITKLKEKGYEMKITNKNYNDGILTNISGSIKYKDNTASFTESGFSKITIAAYQKNGKTYFRIDSGQQRRAV